MHEPWDENYSRGYQWWLMTEAKKVAALLFSFITLFHKSTHTYSCLLGWSYCLYIGSSGVEFGMYLQQAWMKFVQLDSKHCELSVNYIRVQFYVFVHVILLD